MENFKTAEPDSGQKEAIDSRWYGRFKKIGSFQAYEYLDGDREYREAQRLGFLSGQIENPELDYPKINFTRITEIENALMDLKADIISQESDEFIKQVYRWKINEKIAEIRLLQAVKTGEARRFELYSQFIYGKPSPEIFNYTLYNLRLIVENGLKSDNPLISALASELVMQVSLPKNLESYQQPDEETIAAVRVETLRELGVLTEALEAPDNDSKLNAAEIRLIFEQALDKLQADGWSIVIDQSSKTAISVDQENKSVKVPESRMLAFSKLRTLIAHEIGTHVARRVNGERSKLKLLGLGLDRYEKGEEGVATMREQVLDGDAENYSGFDGHFAIGLAVGLDGHPRNFREVYSILEKYYFMKSLLSGKDQEAAFKLAQKNAWNRTVRTFRGTDCKTRGICFTKDIIYREGNIGVWTVAKNNPEEIMRFSVGKYDPANPRHIYILNQLGISDSDLDIV
jgi:hypothetical protein